MAKLIKGWISQCQDGYFNDKMDISIKVWIFQWQDDRMDISIKV